MGTGRKGRVGLIISCEHGGNDVPLEFAASFLGRQALLDSHRGFDPGALLMATTLANALSGSLVGAHVSRLLVDLNRSLGHPKLHDPFIRRLPASVRQRVVATYHTPYRDRVEALVSAAIDEHGHAIHISSHSFTPVLDGKLRRADIGLLYDPGRPGELALCAAWKQALADLAPSLVVRRNYPYQGDGDGVTRWLRGRFDSGSYVGVELEINQRLVGAKGEAWSDLRETVVASLQSVLAAPAALFPR